jgi:hypothetical protein
LRRQTGCSLCLQVTAQEATLTASPCSSEPLLRSATQVRSGILANRNTSEVPSAKSDYRANDRMCHITTEKVGREKRAPMGCNVGACACTGSLCLGSADSQRPTCIYAASSAGGAPSHLRPVPARAA